VHDHQATLQDRAGAAGRRAIELAVTVVLVVVTLPVMVAAAVGSAVVLRAWPLFVQERIGRDGVPFRFVKIRTLPTSVPRYLDKHALAAHEVPRFCRALRRLHLDELPQLFLVLTGRMGLVGPRPEMAVLHGRLDADFARLRTSVRPGCTGMWQISSGCGDLIGSHPEYDRHYLANRSLRLDLWILARTVLMVLGRDTVHLADVPAWARRAEVLDLELANDELRPEPDLLSA
jgi:lipopolysaccharide/colanic/teichoic acid biosynthesis glycosyltransferase